MLPSRWLPGLARCMCRQALVKCSQLAGIEGQVAAALPVVQQAGNCGVSCARPADAGLAGRLPTAASFLLMLTCRLLLFSRLLLQRPVLVCCCGQGCAGLGARQAAADVCGGP